MKALKVCAYIGALAAAILFYVKTDQLVKQLEAVNQQSAAPVVAQTSVAPSEPVAQPAQPAAPVEESETAVEHPASAPAPAERAAQSEQPTPVTGYTPSCADPGNLRQAVNPTPRGTPYRGQLLVSTGTGRRSGPCTRARAFSNTGESYSVGTLPSGSYQLAYGRLTVH